MQRRAAAIWAALFIVLAAGSYVMIGVAQEPAVTVNNPAYSLSSGSTPTIGGRTYTVQQIQSGSNEGNDLRSTDLTWVNQSATFTAPLNNNSTLPPGSVTWQNQQAQHSASLQNNSPVTLGGTRYTVQIAPGESPTKFTLKAGNSNQTHSVGDALTYQGQQVTVSRITSQAVTVVWGEPYRVSIPNGSSPSSFTLTQDFNVSARLKADRAVENQTITRADGQRYVVYEANGSTEPLSQYLPKPEQRQFSEGDTLQYKDNSTTVTNVSAESVTLTWTAPKKNTISLDEGTTTTLGDTQYVAHFPDNGTLELSSDVPAYHQEAQAVDTFHERMSGLWAISIISGLAAVLLLAAAYLPSRY